jgi:RimJ/RimL family protein N-acetyltransferase
VRTSPGAATAELAVAVPDEHARRGVASGLVARLAERARRAGVRCFTGYMLGENLAARRLLEGLGATATRGASPELVEFELRLDELARVA